jgi:D-aminopeptidase
MLLRPSQERTDMLVQTTPTSSPLFQAVREAVEEAVCNSLFMAGTVTGHEGHTVEAIPVDKVLEICREHTVIRQIG